MKAINPADVPKITLQNGENKIEVPCIGMGTFGSDRFSSDEVSRAVYGALKKGYRMFDCAACYGNEAQIGEVFQQAFADGLCKREDLYVMSKVWNDMHGQGDVLLALAKTLKDLQLDYVDMYFVHWPFPNYHAPGCNVDARNPDSKPFSVERFLTTWRQMERLVDLGLAKAIGMSNMTIPKLEAVLPLCRIKPAMCELELHPCFQQQELFDYLCAHDIQPVGYMPIGSPKRPERDMMPEDIADLELPQMQEIAAAHGCHAAIIALKWAVQRGQIPIPFSVHEKNYMCNLACTCDGDPLTDAEMEKIAGLEKNNRLVKGQVFLWEGAADWHDLWDEDGIIVDCPETENENFDDKL